MNDLLAIIPANNEEKNIKELLNELNKYLKCGNIVVIVNGSTDSTFDICKDFGVNVVNIKKPIGVGGAMKIGWEFFEKSGIFKYWVQIDGDNQFPLNSLNELYDEIRLNELDLIIGSRYLEDNTYQEASYRKLGNQFFSKLTSKLTGKTITDCSSGYRMGNQKLAMYFLANYINKHPDAPIMLKILRENLKIKELPVTMKKRVYGVSILKNPINLVKYPIETILIMFFIDIKFRFKKYYQSQN